ncbi:hypothetical protein D9757_009918 [Collybiopsis confluens]|uniref:Uncharacterized protein n=1 Tax=Collybiopsis confluens TaxID=2823264 RepID=A0A8H5GWP6_9AGAR|nr:hypothetical protein D9757_009918 [Collybiopsis confluens]
MPSFTEWPCGKDSKIIKGTVAALGTLASLEFTFISHQIYVDYVERFNNPASLDIIVFGQETETPIHSANCRLNILAHSRTMDTKSVVVIQDSAWVVSACYTLPLWDWERMKGATLVVYVISVVSMLTTRGALRAELGRGGITTLPGSFPLSTYGGSNTYQSYENQPTIPNTTVLTLQDPAVENYSSKRSMV